MVEEIRKHINRLLAVQDRVIVAIDGSCASGKTTLAEQLALEYRCNVLHVDDFFLRPEQRTEARLSQPGGNVDYERFAREVLHPLTAAQPFSYRPFDCSIGALAEPVPVNPDRLTIIEGSYALHPYFGEVYDLKIFLTVDENVRRQRILRRPAFLHSRFFNEWIPMEQLYFQTFGIRDRCHLVLDTLEAELQEILRTHAAKYPLMEPTDAVKLIYQNEFGGGHLIRDEEACIAYLRREYAATPQVSSMELTEDIGNGICRVMLGALDSHGCSPEMLGRLFIRSADQHRGDLPVFLRKLEILRQLTAEGIFAFSPEDLDAYLAEYARADYPPVSHSAAYRAAYGPAYRIVLSALLNR